MKSGMYIILGTGILDWLIGLGGVLMFTGCLGVAVLLRSFVKKGFLALGEPLLSLLTIFLFIVGVNALLYSLVNETSLLVYPTLFRVISGIAAVYLAWRIFTERNWPESIYSSDDVLVIKSISKKIQDHSKIGFWWLDSRDKKMKWSSGMYSIHGKDPSWTIDSEEVDSMIHPDDIHKVRQIRNIGGTAVFRLVSPRRYLQIKSENGDWGSVQDITEIELDRQSAIIEKNTLTQKISFQEADIAVRNFLNQTPDESRRNNYEGP